MAASAAAGEPSKEDVTKSKQPSQDDGKVVESVLVDDKTDEKPAVDLAKILPAAAVDPVASFQAARDIVAQLHETLDRLAAAAAGRPAAISVDAADSTAESKAGSDAARTAQLQLLALRRAHRGTASAAESGRAAEQTARRLADAEFAHLETRRYESACNRAAARRLRATPTPALARLRECIPDGAEENDEVNKEDETSRREDASAVASRSALYGRLQTEGVERTRLAAVREALETEKIRELKEVQEKQSCSADLAAKLRAVERALEPVCDLIELKGKPATAVAASAKPELVARLPEELRLIYAKFQVLASYGPESGISVHVDDTLTSAPDANGEPQAKRPRTATAKAPPSVCIEIANESAGMPVQFGSEPDKLVRLLFSEGAKTVPVTEAPAPGEEPRQTTIVTVMVEGSAGDSTLGAMWAGDDGQGPLAKLLPSGATVGRPYGWAQILAGCRAQGAALAPQTFALPSLQAGITASDIVHKVREHLAKTNA
eukprot:TRINITY_DN12677_c0_g1_i1.p1 TRINITY_DN12677_c0_g1~~TRINITY_DN12677_c0_g1_i1.p1  ORF type:complete len:492 (+),score=96.36 TRINITY_DN12677_c0_g1_i1:109-1584(+)